MEEREAEKRPSIARNECASRMSTRAVLADKIRRLEREAAALRVLIDAIPWKILSQEAEELLWIHFGK